VRVACHRRGRGEAAAAGIALDEIGEPCRTGRGSTLCARSKGSATSRRSLSLATNSQPAKPDFSGRWTLNIAASEFAGARLAIPLAASAAPSFRLDPAVGDGWLAVGDAASAFDPISSQGIYKALADGIEAAGAIAAALDGRTGALQDYQSMVADRFAAYWRTRDEFYRMEQRWSAAPFWRKRCERGARSPTREFAEALSG
jgi:2-polyprenyl-6-methoxyphenol hydroxylase-like FAD-dependent oxidoreductase